MGRRAWSSRVARWGRGLAHSVDERLLEEAGGPARRLVVVCLSLVLALDAADRGAVGAIAFELERGLHIGNTDVGLMVTLSSLVAAVATLPFGVLVDRTRRVRLLWSSIVVWGVAEALGGLAPSFGFLVGTRILLGVAAATAGPAVASLTGDFFPARDRGHVWGLILAGEVLGTGVGVVYAGLFGSAVGWRAALFALTVPSLLVAWFLRRTLPEPARGGASRLPVGAPAIPATEPSGDGPGSAGQLSAAPGREPADGRSAAGNGGRDTDLEEELRGATDPRTQRIIEERGIEPEPEVVVDDPARLGVWASVRHLLRIRTNLALILSSSIGYFFLAGLETFALIFLRGNYGLNQGTATLIVIVVGVAVLAGLLVAGRLGDRLVRQGRIETRITIGVVGFGVAAVALAPAIAASTLAVAVPLFMVAAFALAAPNPGLDAARLDVVPSGMWGRSEGVRTVFRQSLQGLAPLVFGVVSEAFGAPSTGFGAGVGSSNVPAAVLHSQVHGLELTFLVMLVPLVAGGLLLLPARRSYLPDVAAALETDRRSASGDVGPPQGDRAPAASPPRPGTGGDRPRPSATRSAPS